MNLISPCVHVFSGSRDSCCASDDSAQQRGGAIRWALLCWIIIGSTCVEDDLTVVVLYTSSVFCIHIFFLLLVKLDASSLLLLLKGSWILKPSWSTLECAWFSFSHFHTVAWRSDSQPRDPVCSTLSPSPMLWGERGTDRGVSGYNVILDSNTLIQIKMKLWIFGFCCAVFEMWHQNFLW